MLENNFGTDPRVSTVHGLSALHFLVYKRFDVKEEKLQMRVIKLLIDNGASINQKTVNDDLPLHFACAVGDPEIVEYLLSFKGRQVDAPNRLGDTPLYIAARHGHEQIVDLLLQAGASAEYLPWEFPNPPSRNGASPPKTFDLLRCNFSSKSDHPLSGTIEKLGQFRG